MTSLQSRPDISSTRTLFYFCVPALAPLAHLPPPSLLTPLFLLRNAFLAKKNVLGLMFYKMKARLWFTFKQPLLIFPHISGT